MRGAMGPPNPGAPNLGFTKQGATDEVQTPLHMPQTRHEQLRLVRRPPFLPEARMTKTHAREYAQQERREAERLLVDGKPVEAADALEHAKQYERYALGLQDWDNLRVAIRYEAFQIPKY